MTHDSPPLEWADTLTLTPSEFELPEMEEEAEPIVRSILDLQRAKSDDGNTLLGNRFLCRGGGLLFVGSSGIGKSTAMIQMGVCWAVGRTCFGIVPARPLKILYVQAENDEGDLCEMRDGVLEYLKLTQEELDTLERNFSCAFESSRTGEKFITDVLQPLLEKHSPDLVILDPILSYLGGDANEQKMVGGFLRNLLNPLLQLYNCGAVVVHHTAKPFTRGDNGNRVATDFAYLGAGSAEWANWARAVLVLSAKNDEGVRELRIGKRFRLGWKDGTGNSCVTKLLRQNSEGGGLYYTEVSAEDAAVINRKLTPFEGVLRSDVLPASGDAIPKEDLITAIAAKKLCGVKLCGVNKARDEVIPALVSRGYLEEFDKPRRGAPAEKWLRRTDKTIPTTSFATFTAPAAVSN